jgi:hypothetical protein
MSEPESLLPSTRLFKKEKPMSDQPTNPTTWPGPTAPQAHPATGVPEQNPRPIGPATGKPSTGQPTEPGMDA